MKKQLLFASLALAIGAMPMSAKEVSPEEALAIAKQFTAENSHQRMAPQALKLAYTVPAIQGNALYIFTPENGAPGFTIVSGNDIAAPVLGYSETSPFDKDNLPENFLFFMSFYADQINNGIRQGAPKYTISFPDDTKPNIEPIMTTTWDQGSPYNKLCPSGTYTGCVATAMAQAMKVFEYPASASVKGIGRWSSYRVERTYKWDKMLDGYAGSSYTSAQGSAVAELMVDCGKTVNMSYSYSGSGANTDDVPNSLIGVFKYDPGMIYTQRSFFTPAMWNDLMYRELRDGRPIIYGGFGNGFYGGHQFIIDGYQTGGKFHLNWGWEGSCDGWYYIDGLNPSEPGAGGGMGSYNTGCDAVINMKTPTGDTYKDRQLANCGKFGVKSKNGKKVTFGVTNGKLWTSTVNGIIHVGGNSFKAYVGVRLINADPEAEVRGMTLAATDNALKNFPKWGRSNVLNQIEIDFSEVPAGTWFVYPMSKAEDDEDWIRVLSHNDKQQYVKVTINEEGTITTSDPGTSNTQHRPVIYVFTDSHEYAMEAGETKQIVAEAYPVEATFGNEVSYESENPEIATVDENGLITGVANGETRVKVEAKDGSGIIRRVNVKVGTTGVGSIAVDENAPVDVYNAQGILVLKQATRDMIDELPTGIYIAGGKKYMVR